MASNLPIYTRLPMPIALVNSIQKIRDYFNLPVWSDAHVTQLFIGRVELSEETINDCKKALSNTFTQPIEFKVNKIRKGDFDPFIFIELAFSNTTDEEIYLSMYQSTFDLVGPFVTMTNATRDNPPTRHVTIMTPQEVDLVYQQMFSEEETHDATKIVEIINDKLNDITQNTIKASTVQIYQGGVLHELTV